MASLAWCWLGLVWRRLPHGFCTWSVVNEFFHSLKLFSTLLWILISSSMTKRMNSPQLKSTSNLLSLRSTTFSEARFKPLDRSICILKESIIPKFSFFHTDHEQGMQKIEIGGAEFFYQTIRFRALKHALKLSQMTHIDYLHCLGPPSKLGIQGFWGRKSHLISDTPPQSM